MSYIGNQPAALGTYATQAFTGNASATAFTLSQAATTATILVSIDGVDQIPTTAYSVAADGVTLNFTSAPPASTISVRFLGDVVDFGEPSDDSVATVHIQDDAVTAAKLANSINTEIAANTAKTGITSAQASAITANTAKVTNATHTGDVTGSTALTIATDAVDIAMLSATGTASATTFLRGDNSWNALSEYNDTAIRNDISTLALHSAIADNKAAHNLSNSFIDQFESDAGLDNQTNVDRLGDPEYMSSVSSSSGAYHINAGGYAASTGSSGGHIPTFSTTNNARTSFGQSTGSSGFSINNQTGANSGLFTFELTLVQKGNGNGPNMWPYGVMKNSSAMPAYTGNTYSAYPSGNYWNVNASVGSKIKVVYDTDSPNVITTYADTGSGYGAGSTTLGSKGANFDATAITTLYFFTPCWSDSTAPWIWDTTGTRVFTSASATGSFTSATQTALASVSSMGIVVLYKNAYGTASLNTDIVAEVSANGGTNYASATLVAGGTFSTGINIAAVSGVSVTAGTTPKYRISFANQASSSKETQVHGVALLY